MASETRPLRVYFFPFLAQGHLIPMLDIAKLFASNGVDSTLITTPANSSHMSKSITKSTSLGHAVTIKTIPFQSTEFGLPQGCENIDTLPSTDLFINFFQAANSLQKPLEELLELETPDCLISDLFFPWSLDSAEKVNVPRIVFHGTSFFAMCAMDVLRHKKPYNSVCSDEEMFCLPDLPDEIRMTRNQFPIAVWDNTEKGLGKLKADAEAACDKSYGMIVNSFFELEPSYADFYRNVLNKKAWCVGPVSVCNRNVEEKGMRGKESAIEDDQCLKWLDGKPLDSVVYICFGSSVNFPDAQLREIAIGLELSGQYFIWVIRRRPDSRSVDYLPEGFEDRVKDRGLLIRGWAPQVLILDHPSVGGFVTHCGWNSTLEGLAAGQPLVTWPLFAEQFFNEKLVTSVLKIGVGVGTKKWSRNGEDHIDSDKIEKAVRIVMEGEEAEERRCRARQFGKLANMATEKDGSSYIVLQNLLNDLKARRESCTYRSPSNDCETLTNSNNKINVALD